MTATQLAYARIYLGIDDTNVLSDDTINHYIAQAAAQDYSGADDYCIALLACSMIAQTAQWLEITRQPDGTVSQTSDTFLKLLEDRLNFLGKNDMLISDEDYVND